MTPPSSPPEKTKGTDVGPLNAYIFGSRAIWPAGPGPAGKGKGPETRWPREKGQTQGRASWDRGAGPLGFWAATICTTVGRGEGG
jgi:hypothetical protein